MDFVLRIALEKYVYFHISFVVLRLDRCTIPVTLGQFPVGVYLMNDG